MKAVRIKNKDEIMYETVANPVPQSGEVLISVKACGVNHLDLHILKGRMTIPLPHIPGSDISGIVKEINGASTLTVGQEVLINPAIPCNDCSRCKKGLSCGSVAIFGYKTPGGYAEYVTAPIAQVYAKPDTLSFIEAASFPLTFLTAWHMLTGRAHLQKGERVFIWGASGGLGSAAVQIAKHLGAEVIAAASTQEDAEKIQARGAEHVVFYTKENVFEKVNKVTNGEMVEVVFESVGEKTWDTSLSLLQPYGRLVIAGTTSGSEVPLNLLNLYRHQYSLLGASMGTKEEFEQVLQLFAQGKLKPVIDQVFPLEKAADALKKMEESKQMGKIVLEV